MPAEMTFRTGTTLKNRTVRKEVTTIQAIAYTHEPIRELDDEKTTDIVRYRTSKDSIRRPWGYCKNFIYFLPKSRI